MVSSSRSSGEITPSKSLSEILNGVVRTAQEQIASHPRTALFLVDVDRVRLRFAAAAGLSPEYTRAVDGFGIQPSNPSCGSAAYTGENEIVGDVATDPKWSPFLALAREHGIRACWSIPFKSDGVTLGTLAAYHDSPRLPGPADMKILEELALVAADAVQLVRSRGATQIGAR